jgi:hypothetical protein
VAALGVVEAVELRLLVSFLQEAVINKRAAHPMITKTLIFFIIDKF